MEFDSCLNYLLEKYSEIDRYELASLKDIELRESVLGITLPDSYKKFICIYSNGINLLDVEPIGGVSEYSPCGFIDFSDRIIPSLEEKVLLPDGTFVPSNELICLTTGNNIDCSCTHWAFICNKEYDGNEYPVGLISQMTGKVVYIIENFQKWLSILIEGDINGNEKDVISIIFPNDEEKYDILDE